MAAKENEQKQKLQDQTEAAQLLKTLDWGGKSTIGQPSIPVDNKMQPLIENTTSIVALTNPDKPKIPEIHYIDAIFERAEKKNNQNTYSIDKSVYRSLGISVPDRR